MKKYHLILHPFLLAVYPALSLLAFNIDEIAPQRALRSLVISLLSSIVLVLVIRLIARDWHQAGLLSSLIIILFFSYGHIYQLSKGITVAGFVLGRHRYLVGLWALLLGAGIWWIMRRLREPWKVTNYLNVVAAVALVLPTYNILSFLARPTGEFRTDQIQQTQGSPEARRLTQDQLPDIYYIILDGYARADVLQEIFGYDNSEFLNFLTDKGFYVAQDSRSNYAQTRLSLASSMNAEYINYLTNPTEDNPRRSELGKMIKESRIRAFLRGLGYRMISFSSGYVPTDIQDADLYLSPGESTINEFEIFLLSNSFGRVLMEKSPAFNLVTRGKYDPLMYLPYATHRARILYTFEHLADIPTIPGPKFVFVHILAPHPPFVFGQNGEEIEPDIVYNLADGSYFKGTQEEYISGYRNQLIYLNKLVKKVIEEILVKSTTSPIIILQGDHGSGVFVDWSSTDRTCLKERMSILNAYLLPGGGENHLYNSITPVNSFRVIFDTYFGTSLGLLEDKSYFSLWEHPYDFIDVTDRIEESICPQPNAK